MNDTAPDHRQVLRQRSLEQAGAAFEVLFDDTLPQGRVAFDRRERRALEPGQQVIRALPGQQAQEGDRRKVVWDGVG